MHIAVCPQVRRPASETTALASGLLTAHVVQGVPLDRLAGDYGFTVPRLRSLLREHVATCAAVLAAEPEPAAPRLRTRHRGGA